MTRYPTAEWVVQQLRETFPEAGPYRYTILDRDSRFDADVLTFLRATGLKPRRTSIQSPWQKGVAERWVESCRRELLDYVILLNKQHLLRLVRDYISYFHQDRTPRGSPQKRPYGVTSKPAIGSRPRTHDLYPAGDGSGKLFFRSL